MTNATDEIAGKSAVAGEAIHDEIRQRLAALLAKKRAGQSEAEFLLFELPKLLQEIEDLLRGSQPLYEQALRDAVLAAWIGGASDVLVTAPVLPAPPVVPIPFLPPPRPPKPPSVTTLLYPDEPPLVKLEGIDNAVESLLERQVMDADDFYRLTGAAKQQAFTITADLTTESLEKIRGALAEVVREGPSLRAFTDRVLEEFEALPIGPARLEQVYRNAINEAYSQGAETILAHPMVEDGFPFRSFEAIHDARARHDHLAMEHLGLDGTNVYHKDDPTWAKFRPPFAWNCRCGWNHLTVEQAARKGVREAQEWLRTGNEPAHEWVAPPPFSPPAGWDRVALAV